ncbi:MATE family efflux transporter [Marasmitruncus massiliensis]|uniref:MATE family efflux transporter n=1 Tax=Marasmitruncus massiliensis TaxID=1944642 RepID=UPI000C7CEAB0|nr:MATE family efflux transporter [Marasmitruncus massiliensis]MBE6906305.1 MATE family efflux transporter [Oscillospiraceae bacterium]
MFTNQDLKRLIFPLIVEQVLAVTIGMADTIMVSGSGEAAVSGIALVDVINVLLINIFSALATGGAVVSSQYLGKQEPENACVAAKQLIYVTLLFSLVIMLACLTLRDFLLTNIFGNIDPQVMKNAQIYFAISAYSYPFLALYNAGAALFRSMGNSRISMFTSLLMNMANIGGNALLIFGFGMGVRGAAIASLVSRMLGCVIMLLLLRHRENSIHIEHLLTLEFRPAMVRSILSVGVPTGLENGIFQIGKVLVQGLIVSIGTTAIAANAIANNIASMEVIPGAAIGLALITVVGQCVGAQDYVQARQYTIKLMKITYLSMIALNAAILIFCHPIVNVYRMSEQTTSVALQLLIIHGIGAMIIWPLSFTLPNALRAAGDAKFTMTVSIISMWTCRIGLSYLFVHMMGWGVPGVWFAMISDWGVRTTAFVIRFCGSRWQHKRLV